MESQRGEGKCEKAEVLPGDRPHFATNRPAEPARKCVGVGASTTAPQHRTNLAGVEPALRAEWVKQEKNLCVPPAVAPGFAAPRGEELARAAAARESALAQLAAAHPLMEGAVARDRLEPPLRQFRRRLKFREADKCLGAARSASRRQDHHARRPVVSAPAQEDRAASAQAGA